MPVDFVSNSVEQTIRLGEKIGSGLKGGEVIGIAGRLGTGKTQLIKGIASGAGAKNTREVTSPTFVVINEYTGRLDIYHIDAYRLNSIVEFEMLGFDDLCYPGSVVLIEWVDKIEQALKGIDYIKINIENTGKTQRKIQIRNCPKYILTDSPPQ